MAKWATAVPPKKEGRYLVTIEWAFGRQVRQATRSKNHNNEWQWNLLPNDEYTAKIIAWQKCPKAYGE